MYGASAEHHFNVFPLIDKCRPGVEHFCLAPAFASSGPLVNKQHVKQFEAKGASLKVIVKMSNMFRV